MDKAFGEDTASWVSWMSVSMNNYLEKFYLSGLSKYGMHTSRCLTDFMTYYVWHSTRYPSSEQRGNVFAGISVQCAKERNQDAASDTRPSTHTHTRTHARTHVHRKNRDRDRETKRQRQRHRERMDHLTKTHLWPQTLPCTRAYTRPCTCTHARSTGDADAHIHGHMQTQWNERLNRVSVT